MDLKKPVKNPSQSLKIGVILLIMGLVVAGISYKIEQEQMREVYEKRMEYIEEKYPSGTYRGPEVSEYLFKPIPPQPARGTVNLGLFLTGLGILTIFIKIVQKT